MLRDTMGVVIYACAMAHYMWVVHILNLLLKLLSLYSRGT